MKFYFIFFFVCAWNWSKFKGIFFFSSECKRILSLPRRLEQRICDTGESIRWYKHEMQGYSYSCICCLYLSGWYHIPRYYRYIYINHPDVRPNVSILYPAKYWMVVSSFLLAFFRFFWHRLQLFLSRPLARRLTAQMLCRKEWVLHNGRSLCVSTIEYNNAHVCIIQNRYFRFNGEKQFLLSITKYVIGFLGVFFFFSNFMYIKYGKLKDKENLLLII